MIYLYSYLVVSVVAIVWLLWMAKNTQLFVDNRKYYDCQSYGDMYDEGAAPK